jgi:hypothetical protein
MLPLFHQCVDHPGCGQGAPSLRGGRGWTGSHLLVSDSLRAGLATLAALGRLGRIRGDLGPRRSPPAAARPADLG